MKTLPIPTTGVNHHRPHDRRDALRAEALTSAAFEFITAFAAYLHAHSERVRVEAMIEDVVDNVERLP